MNLLTHQSQTCVYIFQLLQETLWFHLSGTNDCCWLGTQNAKRKTLSVVNGKAKSTRILILVSHGGMSSITWSNHISFQNKQQSQHWTLQIHPLRLGCQLCDCSIYKTPQEIASSFSLNFLAVPCLVIHTGLARLQRFDITLTTTAISECANF